MNNEFIYTKHAWTILKSAMMSIDDQNNKVKMEFIDDDEVEKC